MSALQQAGETARGMLKADTMPNGSYPITSQHQADSAWKLRGHSKAYSEAQVVAHIRRQVQKHGLRMPVTQ